MRGSARLSRIDGIDAVEFKGEPATGASSGTAMDAMEQMVAGLPGGYGMAWTELSYQERQAGNQAPWLFALSALVVNGEFYGHEIQRERLAARGHRFATGGDSEVALHLYEEHGPGFLAHLRGELRLREVGVVQTGPQALDQRLVHPLLDLSERVDDPALRRG